MKFRWSITTQLLFLVVAVMLPLVALITWAMYQEHEEDQRQVLDATYRLAQISAGNVELFISDSRSTLENMAGRPLVRAVDAARCDPALADFRELHPQFANILVVNPVGEIVCSAMPRPDDQPTSVAERPWFQHTLNTNNFVVSEPFVSPISKIWVCMLALPIHNDQGGIAGVIALPVDLVRYQAPFNAVDMPPGSVITIIDDEGLVVARTLEPKKWIGKNVRGTEIVDLVLAQGSGRRQATGSDGEQRIYGFAPIPSAGWYAYAGIPTAAAFATVNSRVQTNLVVGLAILIFVCALAIFLSRQLARPIHVLAVATQAVEQGKLDLEVPVEGAPEIANVASRFNHMLAARRRVEARLVESESQYRTLMEQASDGILIATVDGQFVEANPKGCEILGYSREELLTMSLTDVIAAEDLQRRPLRMQDLRDGQPVLAERVLKRKDGSLLTIEVSAKMLQDGRLQGIIRDITERKRAEEALRQSEERFSKAFRASPTPMVISDLQTGLYLDVNPNFARMLGYSIAEMLGRTSIELGTWVTPEDRARLINALQRDSSVRELEVRVRTKEGNMLTVLCSSEMVELGGQECLLTSFIDITHRAAIESQLKQYSMNQARLLDQLLHAQEVERRRLSMDIHDGPLQGLGVSLLTLDRSIRRRERGEYELADAEIGLLRANLTEVVSELRAVLADLSLELLRSYGLDAALRRHVYRFAAGTNINVEINSELNRRLAPETELLMYRLAQESLANIRKHSHAHNVEVVLREAEGRLLLRIRDDGRGFDVQQALSQRGEGHKLGLGSMLERVRGAGGDMLIQSQPGKGTTIEFTCPLTSAE